MKCFYGFECLVASAPCVTPFISNRPYAHNNSALVEITECSYSAERVGNHALHPQGPRAAGDGKLPWLLTTTVCLVEVMPKAAPSAHSFWQVALMLPFSPVA